MLANSTRELGWLFTAMLLLGSTAHASDGGGNDFPWNFKTNAMPKLLYAEDMDRAKHDDRCVSFEEENFSIYKKANPRFAAIPDQIRARREWRKALLSDLHERNSVQFASCLHRNLWVRVREHFGSGEVTQIPICSRGQSVPNASFQEILADLDELTEYALSGHFPAIIYLSGLQGLSGTHIQPDIRYYMSLSAREYERAMGRKDSVLATNPYSRNVFDAGRELTPMRREFIEKAFERGDWRSVLKTTDPCAEPLKTSRS